MASFDITWTAPEFEYHEKTVSWYWTSIVLAIFALALAVWQRNFLFGVFIVIAEVLVLFWANQKPEPVVFRATDKGLTIGGRLFYPWTEIESFSVEESDIAEWPALAFRFRKRLRPALQIRAPKDRLAELQQNIAALLPRTAWDEHLLDTLEKFARF